MTELRIEMTVHKDGDSVFSEEMTVEDGSITDIKATFMKAVCDTYFATCEFVKSLTD